MCIYRYGPLHDPFTPRSYRGTSISLVGGYVDHPLRVNGSWKESDVSSVSLKLAGVTALAASLLVSGCGGQNNSGGASDGGVSGTVTVDGSSTVAP